MEREVNISIAVMIVGLAMLVLTTNYLLWRQGQAIQTLVDIVEFDCQVQRVDDE